MLTYQTEKFVDIWEEVQPLLARHWDEVAAKGMCGELNINEDVYRQAEERGMLHITTARTDGKLVGYAAYFIVPNIHYSHLRMADPDVFFLAPEHRKGRAGIRLLQKAEDELKNIGVTTIVQKVKVSHDCGAIFLRMGYVHVENVWMKKVV